ncbi:MAG: hypothetical protein ACOZEN_10635 [Thermodesulfobacteriota bacterium]|jgi:hypothetical protein
MQVLLHLPDDLAARFKAAVPPRQRSAFVAGLLREALPEEEDPLYLIALEVEKDELLNAEMGEWDALSGDGMEDADEAR